jgi:hypothetical protein
MAHKQTAVGQEIQMKQFSRVNNAKLLAAIDTVLMAFEFLFGCWHRNLSRPFTLSGWTYEVCLTCGKKFAYNRAEIGRGFPKQQEVCPSGTSWHESHTRVSILAGLQ